jgi:hypothetical protein
MCEKRERESANDANYPRGEVRPKNVHRWRMMTGDAHRHKTEKEQHDASCDKLQNRSESIHRFNGLTKRRVSRAEGRAKSPVLSARAVAVVKMADCVS